jgi:hypothetical protein
LHLFVLERWSRGSSAIHRRDPRAKAGVLLVFLIVVATSYRGLSLLAALLLVLLMIVTRLAGLPLGPVLLRSAIVLTFTVMVALAAWLAGDSGESSSANSQELPFRSRRFSTGRDHSGASTAAWPGVVRSAKATLAGSAILVPVLIRGFGASRTDENGLPGTRRDHRVSRRRVRGSCPVRTISPARGRYSPGDAVAGICAAIPHSETPLFRSADAVFLLGASVIIVLVRAAVDRVNG